MGFGISDEVLEKIIMAPWIIPSDLGYGPSYSRSPAYTPGKPTVHYYNPPKPIPVEPPKKNATTKEEDNIVFIKLVIARIRSIFQGGLFDTFNSEDIKILFNNIKDYFESTAAALNIVIPLDQNPENKERRSINYLFQGIADQVFYIITHEHLDKVRFRNIVSDVFSLMKLWELNDTGETVKKKAFFAYYVREFGLSENKYHCCPHCGSKLYSGIQNCPSCFKDIHSEVFVPVQLIIPDGNPDATAADSAELRELHEQLQRAQDTIEAQNSEISARQEKHNVEVNELLQKIEQLKQQIREKDQAINAYRDHINGGAAQSSDTHLKILVIGEYTLTEQETRSITTTVGISYDALEFFGEYSKIKNFAARIKGDTKYAAIIIGAVPHKVKNLDGASSLSALFKREGYPFVVEARTYQGELKFSKESFQRSLSKVAGHLMTKGLLLL